MRLHFLPGNAQADPRAPARWRREFEPSAKQLCALAHRHKANAWTCRFSCKSLALIFDFEFGGIGEEAQSYPGAAHSCMASHVIERLLQDPIDVNAGAPTDGESTPGLFVGYANTGLLFHGGQVPVDGRFQSGFFQHDRMQGLRKAAHVVERGLRNSPYLFELGSNR